MANAHDELEKKLQDSNVTPMSLPLEFLKDITSGFSIESVLGEGGYGVVYKGLLRCGKIIAVKKLFEIHLKEETFQNEVRYLMGIKHQNVVQFIGYCAESRWEAIEQPSGSGKHIFAEIPKRLLCFEYVSNKSLDKHISDASLGLEWNMRYEIIKGICNGLHFLHEECRIVHLDLKPENILMNSTMTPKIADFGLSRIFGEQQSRIVTDSRAGTCGYMAPEYLTQGLVSNKADIFSLGVIVIEIITGRRDYPYFLQDSPHGTCISWQQFTEKVLGSWSNRFVSIPKCKSMERYTKQVRQCIAIALKCVDPSMEKRPTAKDTIQMLNAVDQVRQCIAIALKCVDPSMEKRPTAKDTIQMLNAVDQIISVEKAPVGVILSLDVNRTEPWIITGHFFGKIHIWNYDTRKSMGSINTGDDGGEESPVSVIKFIERKQWFIVGSRHGSIYVYNYKKEVQKVIDLRAEGYNDMASISSLAVHPTKPYVLSSSSQDIQLWDWDKNWECIKTFVGHSSHSNELTFNPKDIDSFASASYDHTVKLWSLDSPQPTYTLVGHSSHVKCLDFFTRDDRQYLITGSDDKTAKIWDMETKMCIYTLEGFMASVISVISHPNIPILVTHAKDGAIHLWSATNFRLKRILNVSNDGSVPLACLMGSRVLFANYSTLSIMEIHDEEPDASQGSNENSV